METQSTAARTRSESAHAAGALRRGGRGVLRGPGAEPQHGFGSPGPGQRVPETGQLRGGAYALPGSVDHRSQSRPGTHRERDLSLIHISEPTRLLSISYA